ncbi:MAG TPA: hypothetical protein VGX92_21330 [Pyrinomonadaceae bacterium]|nr:hypothetical protein [Pyrinomonadaceae bacterium]
MSRPGARLTPGMHPTRISMDCIENLGGFEVVCGRVMPGVRPRARPTA